MCTGEYDKVGDTTFPADTATEGDILGLEDLNSVVLDRWNLIMTYYPRVSINQHPLWHPYTAINCPGEASQICMETD